MSQSDDLRELIGEESFSRLCVAYGGTRLITAGDTAREKMAVVIGPEAAEQVISYFGGDPLEIPKQTPSERRERIKARREAMRNDRKNGLSTREIAVKYVMTERNVRRIIND